MLITRQNSFHSQKYCTELTKEIVETELLFDIVIWTEDIGWCYSCQYVELQNEE